MNVSTALTTLATAVPAVTAGGEVFAPAALALPATAARDRAMPDAAASAAGTTGLQTLAALLAGQNPTTAGLSSSNSTSDVAAAAAPPLPAAVDHGSHDESAIHEDLGLADDADAAPSQASISA